MVFAILLAAPIWLQAQVSQPVSRIVLKNGTVYELREPPRISGGRIVFTTMEGKTYSLSAADVASVNDVPRPTPSPRTTYNPQDSRDLGAIARQQRHGRDLESPGSPTPKAAHTAKPASVPKTTRTPKPTRTPRPTRTPHGTQSPAIRPTPSQTAIRVSAGKPAG